MGGSCRRFGLSLRSRWHRRSQLRRIAHGCDRASARRQDPALIGGRMTRIYLNLWLFLLCHTALLSAQSTRDSAGIRIVDNRSPAWTPAQRFTIAPRPSVVIGEEEGDPPYLLSRVYAAARLPNGHIVIGNSSSSELRFFTSEGRFVKSAGRRGGGPGEFH